MSNTKTTSKFLSLILRHQPGLVGITLDKHGWVDIDTLIKAMNEHGHAMNFHILSHIVENDNKQRYAIKDGRIRANQGHSLDVDLQLQETNPDHVLYHGTQADKIRSILKEGLIKGTRHHVHLSADTTTALTVAKRRNMGYAIISVDGPRMVADGFKFYKSANDVWLTDHVPPKYLKVVITS